MGHRLGFGVDAETMELITKAEAHEQGLKFFFNGKPCKWGHVAKRQVSSSTCYECINISSKNYWREHRGSRPDLVQLKLSKKISDVRRSVAMEKDEISYVTDYPCHYGHFERYTKSNDCVECLREGRKRYKATHGEQIAHKAKEKYDRMTIQERDSLNAKMRDYYQTPQWKEYNRLYQQKYRAKQKAKRDAVCPKKS